MIMFSRGHLSGGRASGFTILEALVIMGVAGLIAASQLPTINFARVMSRKSEQVEFIKCLEAACKMYQEDFQNARQYPWMPYYDQVNGLIMYDPDSSLAQVDGKRSEDIIRTLAPDNQALYYGGCYMPKNATSYVTIPARFLKIPEAASGTEHCTHMTAVDLWMREYRFMANPVTMDPVVYSKGRNNKDETKAHFQWQADANGNHRADKEEMKDQSADFGDDIPFGRLKIEDFQDQPAAVPAAEVKDAPEAVAPAVAVDLPKDAGGWFRREFVWAFLIGAGTVIIVIGAIALLATRRKKSGAN
jgi:type II secretory pathway pseudopilin PulG